MVITHCRFWPWGNTFDVNIFLATAMIDWLIGHRERNMIEGATYRTANSNR